MAKSKDNKPDAESFIAEYQMKYSEAIDRARAAADTTNTPAWRANYLTQLKAHESSITANVKDIHAAAERIAQSDSNEDDEKAVKDAVKSLSEERIRFLAWRSRAVSAFKTSAEACQSIQNDAIRAAQQAERESPLINSGLAGQVSTILRTWPSAAWDDATGSVSVTDGKTAASDAA